MTEMDIWYIQKIRRRRRLIGGVAVDKAIGKILEGIARENGVSVEEVRARMQEALDSAYASGDMEARERLRSVFPDRKP